jgi:hypothetical protein
MAWKRPTSPVAKKFKSQPSARKIRLTLFWYTEDAILVHLTTKSETFKSQNYCDMLRTKLKSAIRFKLRGKIRQDVILLHDNVRPYTANQTVKVKMSLCFFLN